MFPALLAMDWTRRVPAPLVPGRTVRLATDCSGMGAPEMALSKLTESGHLTSVSSVWACDKAMLSRRWLENQLHITPDKIFLDVNLRTYTKDGFLSVNSLGGKKSIHREAAALDLYVAGFPCTPFSSKGLKLGWSDVNSKPFWAAAKTITVMRPKVAILENVMGLKHNNGLEMVLGVLRGIHGYEVVALEGLSNHHFGIPQHRERIYIVMVRKTPDACLDLQGHFASFLLKCRTALCVPWSHFLSQHKVGMSSSLPHAVQAIMPDQGCSCHHKAICKVHPCKCNLCRGCKKNCKWRVSHTRYLHQPKVKKTMKAMLIKWCNVRTAPFENQQLNEVDQQMHVYISL